MKLTLANKKLNQKPQTDLEKGKYFKDIQFKSGNFQISDLEKIVGNGYTITYLYKDKMFNRSNSYMKNNYYGTQFICVDIDSCEIEPKTFVESIKYKPTVLHTTFSNLTAQKGFKYCFHLLYCFDEVIEGENNFNKVFESITEDYKQYVDKNAKDCHRVIFTSNSNLEGYEYIYYGNTYNVTDFIQNTDEIDTFFNQDNNCLKNDSLNISISSNNISKESKNRQTKIKVKNDFKLENEFFNDLNTLERSAFIDKYSDRYIYVTETLIPNEMYIDGYADLRNTNYYIVPSAQYRWNGEKMEVTKIKNGMRNTILWMDAIAFMNIIPNITKEHLVYLLVKEVYMHFINADGQMNNWFIVNKAKEVWNNIDTLDCKPIKKSFKIDKNYWLQRGYNNWLEVARIIRKQMKDNDFGSMYDFTLTVEQNIKIFKEYGIKTKKQTLIKWLKDNGLDYVTDKDQRNQMIIDLYNENNSRSSREIENLCRENGIKVGKDTILKVIK